MSDTVSRRISRALQLAWEGKPPIPLGGPDKKLPLVQWKPYQDRLPTDDEVSGWPWDRATGMALVIGPALWGRHPGLWLLDIEAEHRPEAERWLTTNMPSWQTGMIAESGSRGLHVYGKATGLVTTTKIPWGDVKGLNSLAILPPSQHRSGGVYRWISEGEPTRLDPGSIPGFEATRTPLREVLSEPIPETMRNQTLFRLASKLRGAGLNIGVIETALQAVNAEWCDPPLGVDEVHQIALSAGRYAPNPTLELHRRSAPRSLRGREAMNA